jgi:hypothetical protein
MNNKEKYYLSPKICLNCNKFIEYNKRRNKFCSNNCSATFNNKNRIVSNEQKENTSLSLTSINKGGIKILTEYKRICLFCENEFIVNRLDNDRLSKSKYCSDECSNKNMKINVSVSQLDRVKKGIHKGWQSRKILSYPEEFFIKVLDNNNLKYETNFMIKKSDLGFNDTGNYFLDFYFADKNIDLEIDGKQHNYEDRQESDIIRDESLDKKGINVYRIKWKNINNLEGKSYIENEIKRFLNFYNEYKVL